MKHLKNIRLVCYWAIALLIAATSAYAQKKKLTIEETVFAAPITPTSLRNLTPGSKEGIYYHTPVVNGKEFLVRGNYLTKKIDTLGKTEELFAGIKNIAQIITRQDGSWLVFGNQTLYQYYPDSKLNIKIGQLEKEAENIDINAESGNVAYTKENNLNIFTKPNFVSVTAEPEKAIVYGKAVHRNEYGINKGTFWSPKGNMLAFYRMDERMVTDYPYVDISTIPASEKPFKYPMAGQASHEVTVGVFNISTKKTVYLNTTGPRDQYLTNVTWSPDEKQIYIAVLNRPTNLMQLNVYDAESGAFINTLFEEIHDKYVEPENGPLFLKRSKQFIWQSERNGYNHLYLYSTEGKLLSQLTDGEKVVTKVIGIDPKEEFIYVQMAEDHGMNYRIYKVGLKKKLQQVLTPEAGEHNAILHPSGKEIYIIKQSPTEPRSIYVLQTNDAKKIGTIHTAANPFAQYDVPQIEHLTLKASNGMVLNGRLIKPADFSPTKKYPVIVYVYGGPHAQMIKNTWLLGASPLLLYWAQEGYLVFTLDNRGSANRGLAFEQETYRRLGTAELEDQLTGINYLKQLPYVDANRIGVHGWSFGGFMTTTMLCKAPDVFKVGIAGAPVIDWKMYEIMYTERYMDTPEENPQGYETANLLNYAKDLKGKLMLIHGTADDVVVWQHTIAFVQKAIQNGVDVDYFIYPGHGHGIAGKDRLHLHKKMTQYFKQNL